MGLAFLLKTMYLLPLTVIALTVAVGGLGWGAGRRRGYGPLGLGLLSAIVLIVGRFVFASDEMTYSGVGALIVASLWNAWPRKRVTPSIVELQYQRHSRNLPSKEH